MTVVEKGQPNPRRPLRWTEVVQGGLVGLVVVLVLTVGLVVQRGGALAASQAPARPDVVIIILADALRADRLSCYGYAKHQTPHIDALAQDAVRYSHTIAQAPWTKPSVGTIFTGLYPMSHQARVKGMGLSETLVTLPEVLAAHNYRTVGFINNPMIRPGQGFEQGFSEYIWMSPDESTFVLDGNKFYQEAELMNRRVRAWLQGNRARRFFMYIHYMEPHRPYFQHPYNGQGYYSHGKGDPEQLDVLNDLYDGEVVYLDTHVGALIADLKKEGLYDEALIVFTADHGEEFYEHLGWAHGSTVYQEVIHVPLLIKYPGGWGAGTVDDRLARLLDLAPTILDAADIQPPAAMQGVSLLQPASVQVAFSETEYEGRIARAIVTPRYKLIQVVAGGRRGREPIQLYDLIADPLETTDLAKTHDDVVTQLRQLLDRTTIAALQASVDGKSVEIDPETEQRLRLLGY